MTGLGLPVKQKVLVLCTANSARSQMAEGLLRQLGGDHFEVFSAGTHPASVRPEAVSVMGELGIDISSHRSKAVDEFSGQTFDYIITVCDDANESCPTFPVPAKRIHWSFRDPATVAGSQVDRERAFRKVRDEIAERLREFVHSQDPARLK
jgi:arsenate reductase